MEQVQLGSEVLLEQVQLGSEVLLEQLQLGSEVLLEQVKLGSEVLLEQVQLGSEVLLEQVQLGSEVLLEQVQLGSEVLLEQVQLGSEVLLEQVQLNFSFRNKFIILVPCGPLVDNNTFSKMCVFKSPTVYTDDGGFENKNAHFFNNEFTGNEELMMVILNFTLLHYQNGGLAVRHPYLMVCCKNVI